MQFNLRAVITFTNAAAFVANAATTRGANKEKYNKNKLFEVLVNKEADEDFRPSLSVNTVAAVVSTRSDSLQSKQGRRLYKIALDTLVYNCPGELAPNVCCGGALGCAFESKEGLQNATLAYAYGPNNAIAG